MRVKEIFEKTDFKKIEPYLNKLTFYEPKHLKKIKLLINTIIESKDITMEHSISLNKYSYVKIHKSINPVKLESNKYHRIDEISNMKIRNKTITTTSMEAICASIIKYITQDFKSFSEAERKYYYESENYQTFLEPMLIGISAIVNFLTSWMPNDSLFLYMVLIIALGAKLLFPIIRSASLGIRILLSVPIVFSGAIIFLTIIWIGLL